MKKKIVDIDILLILAITASIVGCSSGKQSDLMKEKKETVVKMYNELLDKYTKTLADKGTAEAKLQKLYSDEGVNPGVTSMGNGTGDLTLNSVANRVQFNSALEYPNSYGVSSTGTINIVDGVQCTAKDNWVTKITGSTLELQHSNGISGSINVSKVSAYIENGTIKDDILSPWIASVTNTSVTYSDIFIDGDIWGEQGIATILVDGQAGIMECGIVTYGEISISYVFVYSGDANSVNDESIKNVINSLQIYGTNVTVS